MVVDWRLAGVRWWPVGGGDFRREGKGQVSSGFEIREL